MYKFHYCPECTGKMSGSTEKKSARVRCPNCNSLFEYRYYGEYVSIQVLKPGRQYTLYVK